jgi:hypothetical protein
MCASIGLKLTVGSLLMLTLIAASPPVAAATEDRPEGTGPAVHEGKPGGQTATPDEQMGVRRDAPAGGELGRGSERPMSMPEESEFIPPTGGQGMTPEMLDELRHQEERAALSF